VEVKLGTSDGVNTAVAANELREGQVVITGEIVATAQTDAKNPFLPVLRRR
jgi:predicted RecA/RadA family phage recombinase